MVARSASRSPRSKITAKAKVHAKRSTKTAAKVKTQSKAKVRTKPKVKAARVRVRPPKSKVQATHTGKAKVDGRGRWPRPSKPRSEPSAQQGAKSTPKIAKAAKVSAEPGHKPKRRLTSKQPPPALGTKPRRGVSAADKRAEATKRRRASEVAVSQPLSEAKARGSPSALETVAETSAEARAAASTGESETQEKRKRGVVSPAALAAATAAAACMQEATAAATAGYLSMTAGAWGGLKTRLRGFVKKGVLKQHMGQMVMNKMEKAEQEADKVERRQQEQDAREAKKIEDFKRKVEDRESKKAEALRQREERETQRFEAKVAAVGARRSTRIAERVVEEPQIDEASEDTASEKPAPARRLGAPPQKQPQKKEPVAKVKKEPAAPTEMQSQGSKRPVRASELWQSYRPDGISAGHWTKMFRSLSKEEREQIVEATRHARIYEKLIHGEEPPNKKASAGERKAGSAASSAASAPSVPAESAESTVPSAPLSPPVPSAPPAASSRARGRPRTNVAHPQEVLSPAAEVPREGDSSPSPDPAIPRPRVVVRHVVRRVGADGEPDRFEPARSSSQAEPMQLEAKQPGAEQPIIEQPSEQLIAEQPGAEQPVAEHPGERQPGEKQPSAEQEEAEQPDAKHQDAAQQATYKPGSEQVDAEQPDAEQPDATQPAVERSDADQFVAEQPGAMQIESSRTDSARLQQEVEPAMAPQPLQRYQQEEDEMDQGHDESSAAMGLTSPAESLTAMSLTSPAPL